MRIFGTDIDESEFARTLSDIGFGTNIISMARTGDQKKWLERVAFLLFGENYPLEDSASKRFLDLRNRVLSIWGRAEYEWLLQNPRELYSTLYHFFSSNYPFLDSVRFGNKPPSVIIGKLEEAEKRYQKKIEEEKRIIDHESYTDLVGEKPEKIMEFPDGSAWFLLNHAFCPIEAHAMGHCGNTEFGYGERILSLRIPVDRNGKRLTGKVEDGHRYWKPVATLILDDFGYLGEMKGPYNRKIDPKYHRHIIELMKTDIVKGTKFGKYLQKNDFRLLHAHPDTVDEQEMEDLFLKKPDLFRNDYYTMRSRFHIFQKRLDDFLDMARHYPPEKRERMASVFMSEIHDLNDLEETARIAAKIMDELDLDQLTFRVGEVSVSKDCGSNYFDQVTPDIVNEIDEVMDILKDGLMLMKLVDRKRLKGYVEHIIDLIGEILTSEIADDITVSEARNIIDAFPCCYKLKRDIDNDHDELVSLSDVVDIDWDSVVRYFIDNPHLLAELITDIYYSIENDEFMMSFQENVIDTIMHDAINYYSNVCRNEVKLSDEYDFMEYIKQVVFEEIGLKYDDYGLHLQMVPTKDNNEFIIEIYLTLDKDTARDGERISVLDAVIDDMEHEIEAVAEKYIPEYHTISKGNIEIHLDALKDTFL